MNFLSKKYIYATSNIKPNTYIGGVASTINTKALLASKLGIPVTRIKMFRIVNEDVQANISGNYTIGASWRYDTQITHFKDEVGLCTSAYSNTFGGCTSLQAVKFPAFKNIPYGFVTGCISLNSVEAPLVLSIDSNNAFNGCISLTSIDFPLCTIVSLQSFANCGALKTVNLPMCETLSAGSFQNCTSLVSINLPKAVTVNGFQGCTNLKTVDLPLATILGSNCFALCSELVTINMPLVQTVDSGTFNGCAKLTTVDLPKVTTIGNSAFLNCALLNNINAPLNTSLGSSVFRYCYALTAISMPNVLTIGSTCFRNCTALVSADFPSCTTIFEGYCFNACTSLIYVNLPNCTQLGASTALNSIFTTGGSNCTVNIHYSMMTVNAGLPDGDLINTVLNVNYIGGIVPEINTEIGGLASTLGTAQLIGNKLGVTSARIRNFQVVGDDIKFYIHGTYNIPSSCFSANTNITRFIDSGNCLQFPYRCFRAATNLIEVVAPNCTIIGDECFYLTKIQNIYFPNVTSFTGGYGAFTSMSFLKTIDLPKLADSSWSHGGMQNCVALELVNVPKLSKMRVNNTNNNYCFSGAKEGFTLNININAQTSNSGTIDTDVQYAITNRSSVVNYIP